MAAVSARNRAARRPAEEEQYYLKRHFSGKLLSAFGIQSTMKLLLLLCLGLPGFIQGGFIDMDTPLDKRTTRSLVDGTVYHLVSLVSVSCGLAFILVFLCGVEV